MRTASPGVAATALLAPHVDGYALADGQPDLIFPVVARAYGDTCRQLFVCWAWTARALRLPPEDVAAALRAASLAGAAA